MTIEQRQRSVVWALRAWVERINASVWLENVRVFQPKSNLTIIPTRFIRAQSVLTIVTGRVQVSPVESTNSLTTILGVRRKERYLPRMEVPTDGSSPRTVYSWVITLCLAQFTEESAGQRILLGICRVQVPGFGGAYSATRISIQE